MRVLVLIPLILMACGEPAANKPTESGELKGTVYGDGVKATETLKISELVAKADELEGKSVRVEGLVTGVCAKRGCWFQMASDKEFESITFKVVDGVMVFPMSMKGKYAVAEGVVQKTPLDLEQTRAFLAHKAEEAGEKFDPESVTEPLTIIQLKGTGAVVRAQP